MKINIKRRRKQKTLNKWFIVVVLIVILLFISTSYSLWSTQLYIEGNVTGEFEPPLLPIDIDMVSNNRYTEGSISRHWLYGNMFSIDSDSFDKISNTLTTKINIEETVLVVLNPEVQLNVSFTIQNNTDTNFLNGNIKLISYSDPNQIINVNNLNNNISITEENRTINSGSSGEISISTTMYKTTNNLTSAYYNFEITYDVDGITHYFYYNIVIE